MDITSSVMEILTKACGSMVSLMEGGNSLQTAKMDKKYMRESLSMARSTEWVVISILMAVNITVNGKMTTNTDRAF